jgi:hypothetical protein
VHHVQRLEHVDDVVDAPAADAELRRDALELDGGGLARGEEPDEVVAEQAERLVLAAHALDHLGALLATLLGGQQRQFAARSGHHAAEEGGGVAGGEAVRRLGLTVVGLCDG